MALRTAMSSAIGLLLMTKCRSATIRDRRIDRDPRSAHGAPYAETLFPCRIATPVIPERHGVPHIRLSRMTASSASVRFRSRLCENLTDAMIPLLNRGGMMKGFVQGADRQQTTLLPECLDDWVDETNPVRAVDVFVDALELRELGFDGVTPAATGRPG